MFIKLSKTIGVTIKFIYKKVKGFLHVGTDNIELNIGNNEKNEDNDLDITVD